MSKRRKDRTLLTPQLVSDLANDDTDALVYWKQILPEDTIQYRKGRQTRTIDFNADYHKDVIQDFRERKAIDQVHFQLAGSDNAHGRDMDPERQRALVEDMATFDQLPDNVKAKVGGKGLYAKMRFFDKKSAKAVRNNPGLGVSARVRENFVRSDGQFVKRGIIHVLGTIDPRVTGMSGWQQADLSYDPDSGYVLDLSNASYKGNAKMAKNKGKSKSKNTDIAQDDDFVPTDAQIESFNDEELDAFIADGTVPERITADDSDDDDDDDDVDDSDADDDDDDDDDDATDKSKAKGKQRETVSMSNRAKGKRGTSEVDLANARADAAESKADRALRRQAERDYLDFSNSEIGQGVPPDVFDDDVEAILSRPDGMVVDLSNEDGDDIDVTSVVKTLVQRLRGTVDLSNESGHGGQFGGDGDNDPDKDVLDALANGR